MKDDESADIHQTTNGKSAIRTGNLIVNLDQRVASVDGQPVHLTRKEIDILTLLLLRKGSVITRET